MAELDGRQILLSLKCLKIICLGSQHRTQTITRLKDQTSLELEIALIKDQKSYSTEAPLLVITSLYQLNDFFLERLRLPLPSLSRST